MSTKHRRERNSRYKKNYSWRHSYELLKNIREVLFIKERFIDPDNDPENTEYANYIEGSNGNGWYYDRDSARERSHEIDPNSWRLNLHMLDEYVDCRKPIELVVGKETKISAFHVHSAEESGARKATKQLYQLLRREFSIPSESLIIYRDSNSGYILAILFYPMVETFRLQDFQECVSSCIAGEALKNCARVDVMTRTRNYVPLPFGAHQISGEKRSLVSADTFKPVVDLRRYAAGHVGMEYEAIEKILHSDFEAIEKRLVKAAQPACKTADTIPDYSECPAAITLSEAEIRHIRQHKKKSVRMILLIIMLGSKIGKTGSSAVRVSMSGLKQMTGLASSTVKSTIAEMCNNDIIRHAKDKEDTVVQAAVNMKGPQGQTYIMGHASAVAIASIFADGRDGLKVPTEATGIALYSADRWFFEHLYNQVMTGWEPGKRK